MYNGPILTYFAYICVRSAAHNAEKGDRAVRTRMTTLLSPRLVAPWSLLYLLMRTPMRLRPAEGGEKGKALVLRLKSTGERPLWLEGEIGR